MQNRMRQPDAQNIRLPGRARPWRLRPADTASAAPTSRSKQRPCRSLASRTPATSSAPARPSRPNERSGDRIRRLSAAAHRGESHPAGRRKASPAGVCDLLADHDRKAGPGPARRSLSRTEGGANGVVSFGSERVQRRRRCRGSSLLGRPGVLRPGHLAGVARNPPQAPHCQLLRRSARRSCQRCRWLKRSPEPPTPRSNASKSRPAPPTRRARRRSTTSRSRKSARRAAFR